MTALKRVIEADVARNGRQCSVQQLLLSEPGATLEFMLDGDEWIIGRNFDESRISGEIHDFDLIIIVDTSAVRQLPQIAEFLLERTRQDNKVLVIDHHLPSDSIGTCRLINSKASSAGEIVYQFCKESDWQLDLSAAEALFVAVSTDTGWFKFQNANCQAYMIAGELVDAGVKPDKLYQQIYQAFPSERLKLAAATLATLELKCDNRLAIMQITRQTLQESGADRTLIENIVNEPMQIGSVIASMLAVELDGGGVRLSLRSKDIVDVNKVANIFGGGGHARAAGASIDEPMAAAVEKVINAMAQAVEAIER